MTTARASLSAVPSPAAPADDDMWAGFETAPPDDTGPDVVPVLGDGVMPSPTNPMAVARELMPTWQVDGQDALRYWRSSWMRWQGTHWSEIDAGAMRADLYPRLEHAKFRGIDNRTGKEVSLPWAPNRGKIANLIEAIESITYLPTETEPPSWLQGGDCEPSEIIACRNGLLNIRSRKLQPHTPRFFNNNSVPFDYAPETAAPKRWLDFLQSVWPDDTDAIALLQEWFGYVLSGHTDMQKIMLMIGPTRSGKGTIARTLTALVGEGNHAGPTLASMGTNFGMSKLIDASLAIISDARLPRVPGAAETIVERLLSISGEDRLDVDRKYRALWTGRIPARFMILSNELPAFADASGAIANRLLILSMETSFLGREDHSLDSDLQGELPGILNWALEGLDRLMKRGRFAGSPASSTEHVELLADSVSPTSAFLRERCSIGSDKTVSVALIYDTWRQWCLTGGREHPGTRETFGRNLLAAIPGLKRSRPYIAGVRVPTYVGVGLGASEDDD
ncbi:phage/plasmid primase, P4 family [Streptomyces sp. NPDC047916]|uniref:DNA primase family protein n=2 Tax=unclassified Streptomyces TaxID=2593676 RepID=UPI0034515BE0